MIPDFKGYAYISGGDNHGKYIDKNGHLYSLQSGRLIAVKTGHDARAERQMPEGQIVGKRNKKGRQQGKVPPPESQAPEVVSADPATVKQLLTDYPAADLRDMAVELKDRVEADTGQPAAFEPALGEDEASAQVNAEILALHAQ